MKAILEVRDQEANEEEGLQIRFLYLVFLKEVEKYIQKLFLMLPEKHYKE